MLLFIDHFDSFTFNLVQLFEGEGVKTQVVRAHALDVADCLKLQPTHIVIGPGPGSPSEAKLSKALILAALKHYPILGVCLGHQCLAEVFGGRVVRAKKPMHGKTSAIKHDGKGLFKDIPQHFVATRYHSLIVERETLPDCLEISAETEAGEVMGLRHRAFPRVESVQFHPESILTRVGALLIARFLTQA